MEVSEHARALSAAERLLVYRPRSEAELRRRLKLKHFSQESIDSVVEELSRQKVLDDERFAKAYVDGKLLTRPLGLERLRRDLKGLGVAPETAERALATAELDEPEAVRELVGRHLNRLQGLPRVTIERRLLSIVRRRGFSSGLAFRVIGELLDEDNQ